ncbi:hypothetical protein PBI_ARCHERS7_147 [Mycobacterium phage ArcherS7]|uniref:Uncharacterized protein n=13 Tax=Bixzunavirus TaxID=680114 RepID=G1BT42_9CAUD|nr:hypothetical protein M181_gp180 [Mycobacterium phage Gizmo]YP_008061403.1 hypothetical protein M180_gp177 [Mycobacterium phage ArcherS7]YP_009017479.1 hypothetical protein MOMOMIXON_148 [Mycobacterium phage MoMoMixon]YP_009017920.1 hypothetical protein PLEIONE_151 [Mycobacterium phage Pleione]YP_009221274.1 hypothetical protein AWH68_gp176 [Mycobacterium phage Breeniome]YP_010057785.1 hypothetical protein KHO61_gp173 [Mycobacterium phage Mangeria]YP_010058471.1 hypothetical protein KHO64_g
MALTYARDNIRYSRTAIDQAVAEGFAKAFETAKGIFYVLKTDQGSFKVTPDMIDEDGMSPEEQAEEEDFHRQAYLAEQGYERFLETRYADAIAEEDRWERLNGARDYWEDKGEAEPTVDEVDELAREERDRAEDWKDTEAAIIRGENALLGRFGVHF